MSSAWSSVLDVRRGELVNHLFLHCPIVMRSWLRLFAFHLEVWRTCYLFRLGVVGDSLEARFYGYCQPHFVLHHLIENNMMIFRIGTEQAVWTYFIFPLSCGL